MAGGWEAVTAFSCSCIMLLYSLRAPASTPAATSLLQAEAGGTDRGEGHAHLLLSLSLLLK